MPRRLRASLPDVPDVGRPVCTLSTRPFNRRNLVKVFEQGANSPSVVVKTSTPVEGSKGAVAGEYRSLSLVHDRLATMTGARFSVPRPLGSTTIGRTEYTAESSAPGRELWRMVSMHARANRTDLIRAEVQRCVEVFVDVTTMLKGEPSVERADATWWDVPSDFPHRADRSHVEDLVSPMAARQYDDCVQHGDYTAANIFVEPATGRITLIDWEHTLRGLPPLYDCFALLISLLPILAPRQHPSANGAAETAQLREMFFEGGRWTDMAREQLLLACDRLSIPHDEVWTMFAQSLVLRTHYYKRRGSPHAELFAALLAAAWHHKNEFLLRA